MAYNVLNEDWEDFDDRKIRDKRDRSKFSCDEPWEVDYLVKVIKKRNPSLSEASIRQAITSCCNSGASRQRDEFVKCVMSKL